MKQWRRRAAQAWLTVGFGEASHRDWLETQVCCWVHQKQGHCVERQLVQLEDKGTLSSLPSLHPGPPPLQPRRQIPAQGKVFLIIRAARKGCALHSVARSPQEVCKEELGKQNLQETKLRVIKALSSTPTSLGAHRTQALR